MNADPFSITFGRSVNVGVKIGYSTRSNLGNITSTYSWLTRLLYLASECLYEPEVSLRLTYTPQEAEHYPPLTYELVFDADFYEPTPPEFI